MKKAMIAIIGEFHPASKPQIMLNQSLEWLQEMNDFNFEWIDTERIQNEGESLLHEYSGIWSAPGSPFKSLAGILEAIRYARINNIPHLGTCGGFQHAVLEFARNILGIKDAQHEEYDNNSSALLITKLTCSLAGKSMSIRINKNTTAYRCYHSNHTEEDYYCNFGINPEFKDRLIHSSLEISGVDQDNEIRIIEIPKNDFFIATLFVPQTRATKEKPHPIINTFIQECIKKSLSL